VTDTKVYLLDLGTLELDGYMMYWGKGPSGPFRFPVYGVLVDHPEGKFVFDTGFDKAFFDKMFPGNAVQSERQTLAGQLDLIGIRPGEITHVLNSHYHVDHVGGNKHCIHATTVCHKCELEAVRHPEHHEELGYSDKSFAPELMAEPVYSDVADDIYTPRFELISGDQEVARGVHIFETPGHTPGHYSMMVQLANRRPMLFTGDACYTQRNIEDDIISNSHSDVKQAFQSLQRLRDLAEQHDAELFYSHDPKAWTQWRTAPFAYL
jgi:4-pyridoxolactonase